MEFYGWAAETDLISRIWKIHPKIGLFKRIFGQPENEN